LEGFTDALEARLLDNGITFAATAEDRKKLSYFQDDEFYTTEDIYNDASDQLHDAINNSKKAERSACNSSTDSTLHDEMKSSSLKLPRIALPTFSGKFSQWENFHHTFESLIDSNDTMSNILKFHYLKLSVTDDAALLINRFQISSENYIVACKMSKYDDKRALIHAHIHSFASLLKGISESATELKKLRDTISVAFAALLNLGCHVSH
jgi:hypothetical protein